MHFKLFKAKTYRSQTIFQSQSRTCSAIISWKLSVYQPRSGAFDVYLHPKRKAFSFRVELISRLSDIPILANPAEPDLPAPPTHRAQPILRALPTPRALRIPRRLPKWWVRQAPTSRPLVLSCPFPYHLSLPLSPPLLPLQCPKTATAPFSNARIARNSRWSYQISQHISHKNNSFSKCLGAYNFDISLFWHFRDF